MGDFMDFIKTTMHNPQVIVDHVLPLAAELFVELIFNGAEQGFLIEIGLFHHMRGSEKGALEGDALHTELQLGIGGLFTGDLEGIDVEDMNVIVDDVAL